MPQDKIKQQQQKKMKEKKKEKWAFGGNIKWQQVSLVPVGYLWHTAWHLIK